METIRIGDIPQLSLVESNRQWLFMGGMSNSRVQLGGGGPHPPAHGQRQRRAVAEHDVHVLGQRP